jgi:hypothetical protein
VTHVVVHCLESGETGLLLPLGSALADGDFGLVEPE